MTCRVYFLNSKPLVWLRQVEYVGFFVVLPEFVCFLLSFVPQVFCCFTLTRSSLCFSDVLQMLLRGVVCLCDISDSLVFCLAVPLRATC